MPLAAQSIQRAVITRRAIRHYGVDCNFNCAAGETIDMTDHKSVLIVGETPEKVDFSDPAIPRGLTAAQIRQGLESSLDDLRANGRIARLVYLDTKETAPAQLAAALDEHAFDVIVVGAGLRIIPAQTEMFEVVMNIIHATAPKAKLAFNLSPDDSARAAERQLSTASP
jgi:hypothetical protein